VTPPFGSLSLTRFLPQKRDNSSRVNVGLSSADRGPTSLVLDLPPIFYSHPFVVLLPEVGHGFGLGPTSLIAPEKHNVAPPTGCSDGSGFRLPFRGSTRFFSACLCFSYQSVARRSVLPLNSPVGDFSSFHLFLWHRSSIRLHAQIVPTTRGAGGGFFPRSAHGTLGWLSPIPPAFQFSLYERYPVMGLRGGSELVFVLFFSASQVSGQVLPNRDFPLFGVAFFEGSTRTHASVSF